MVEEKGGGTDAFLWGFWGAAMQTPWKVGKKNLKNLSFYEKMVIII